MTKASKTYNKKKEMVRENAKKKLSDMGYESSQIDGLDLYVFETTAQFCKPSKTKSDGLLNDHDTRPIPVMVYDTKTETITFL